MRKGVLLVWAVAAACASGEKTSADTAVAADSISDRLVDYYTGVWDVEVRPEGSDSVVTIYTLNTTDNREWYFAAPDQKPVTLRVKSTRGDTVYTETGTFTSAIKPGVQATATSRAWFDEDDRLVGVMLISFETGGPDSVVTYNTYGRRKQ